MLKDDKQEYVYSIALSDCAFYQVDHVFNTIAAVMHPCDHRPWPHDTRLRRSPASVETKVEERIPVAPKSELFCCEDCKDRRKKYRWYLCSRLHDAVIEKKIEVFKIFPDLKVSPPYILEGSYYPQCEYYDWAMRGNLSKADLIKFCSEQHIGVEFKCRTELATRKSIEKENIREHGNVEVNRKRRQEVIDKALECRKLFRDNCRNGTGWAETLDQKAQLFWPDGELPLAKSTIEKLLRRFLKNEKSQRND